MGAFRNYLEDLTRFQDVETAVTASTPIRPTPLRWGGTAVDTGFEGTSVPPPVRNHPVFAPGFRRLVAERWGGGWADDAGGGPAARSPAEPRAGD